MKRIFLSFSNLRASAVLKVKLCKFFPKIILFVNVLGAVILDKRLINENFNTEKFFFDAESFQISYIQSFFSGHASTRKSNENKPYKFISNFLYSLITKFLSIFVGICYIMLRKLIAIYFLSLRAGPLRPVADIGGLQGRKLPPQGFHPLPTQSAHLCFVLRYPFQAD